MEYGLTPNGIYGAGMREYDHGGDLSAVVVNQSGLPDHEVQRAVAEQWSTLVDERWLPELSAFNPAGTGGYQNIQSTPKSLFVRADYKRPENVIEEMELAMRLVQEDDDVANTIGMMSALAFSGMRNQHEDEKTEDMFNAAAYEANLDLKLRELYENVLTTGQSYMLTVYRRAQIPNGKSGANPSMVVPAITYLNPLSIRVAAYSDFGDPPLIQELDERTHGILRRIYDKNISPVEANEFRKSNPIAMELYTEPYVPDPNTDDELLQGINNAWYLNPKMVRRYTLTANSSVSKYAPLLMKRVFGLCEAKRLLNLMDYALLNGAINFLIVVRKGSDKIPAHPTEIANLQSVVRQASRSGVMVGDHRLNVDVIMPNMESLLDPEKRGLLGRKIAKSLLRLPDIEFGRVEGGGTPEAEITARVLQSDRLLIKRLIERNLYAETAQRNSFNKGTPGLWFPPINISGAKFFNEQILKLRDRGDIARSTGVELTGLDPKAEMAKRDREVKAGFDKTMTAVNVPNSGDTPLNEGRPNKEDEKEKDNPTGNGDS